MNGKFTYFLILFVVLFLLCSDSGDCKTINKNTKSISDLARAEEQSIIEALEVCYIDIGYCVSIENLNDLPGGTPIKEYDNINQLGGTPVIDISTGLFKPGLLDLTKAPHLWLGPYITYQPSRVSDSGAGYDPGTLIDFWNKPYYFFSPLGLLLPDSRSVSLDLYGDYFDRYAIVSLGPDGVVSDDDIVSFFGGAPTKTVISRASPPEAYAGDTITVRGYNLGSAKSHGRIFPGSIYLGDKQMSEIISWSDRSVSFKLSENAESGDLKIISQGSESNTLHFKVLNKTSRVQIPWELYE